jgi:drug/metabolite transporter (DMT)-like permease
LPRGLEPLRHRGRKSRSLIDIALFAVYTASSVVGLLLLKHALPLARIDWQGGSYVTASVLLLACGACLYIASFAVWLFILARHELSAAYPAAIGLTLAFSTIGAALLLSEPLSPLRLAGIALIFIGILLVTRY